MNKTKRCCLDALQAILKFRELDVRFMRDRVRQEARSAHSEVSGVFSLYDSPGQPTRKLIDLLPKLAEEPTRVDLKQITDRGAPSSVFCWPGEHYRLLAAIVRLLQPLRIVEIGTFTGLSALSMVAEQPPDSQLVTFDVIPWSEIPTSFLRPTDFESGRLRQIIGDLSDRLVCLQHEKILCEADLMFVDGPKDRSFEENFLSGLARLSLNPNLLVIVDDIRLWNMLKIWRSLDRPKLDVTSLGHHTGTGLIDWNGGW